MAVVVVEVAIVVVVVILVGVVLVVAVVSEAEQKEGYDCLLAQVKAGTIMSRRHVRLPADATVPWPKNQQVRYITEKKLKTIGTEEVTQHLTHHRTKVPG